jgi:hypothetical protein
MILDDWALLNHWLSWAKGCVRMVTYVAGGSRYVFEIKATDPVDGDYIQERGEGPTLYSAASNLMFAMNKHLTEPMFTRTLGGGYGGVMGGEGARLRAPAAIVRTFTAATVEMRTLYTPCACGHLFGNHAEDVEGGRCLEPGCSCARFRRDP